MSTPFVLPTALRYLVPVQLYNGYGIQLIWEPRFDQNNNMLFSISVSAGTWGTFHLLFDPIFAWLDHRRRQLINFIHQPMNPTNPTPTNNNDTPAPPNPFGDPDDEVD